ncbi:hypothetical protein [Ornithinimicrobium murale]|nr:hypothetical protein [Ornithinimicrobium murale]
MSESPHDPYNPANAEPEAEQEQGADAAQDDASTAEQAPDGNS